MWKSGSSRALAIVLGLAGHTAVAQERAKQIPVGEAKLQAVVGNGLVELREGKPIDLTNKQILLLFRETPKTQLERKSIYVSVNGASHTIVLGQRFDLKQRFAKELQDRDKCYFDLIDVVAPKGAPATATLRFHCL